MLSKLVSSFAISFIACVALTLTGCDSGWSGVHKKEGPLPLSSPDVRLVRLVDKRTSFEIGKELRLLWDEGKGPIVAQDRIKPLLDSIPKELNDRLHSTRKVPAKLYVPFPDSGTIDEPAYDTWVIVVSLNPDVLIASVHETPPRPHDRLPPNWGGPIDQARREHLNRRIEFITGGTELVIYAGTLVPWSKEMYVFSTDPKVKNGQLMFENDRAEVLLPIGKLLLVHHDDDVEVTRE